MEVQLLNTDDVSTMEVDSFQELKSQPLPTYKILEFAKERYPQGHKTNINPNVLLTEYINWYKVCFICLYLFMIFN